MTIHIAVTQEDIDGGVHKSHCECPIARAIARTVHRKAIVLANVAFIGEPLEVPAFLPPAAQEFVQRFDSFLTVEPFAFSLSVHGAFSTGGVK